MVFVSQPAPGGHLVVVVVGEDGGVTASFNDDGSVRDITEFAADLAILGLAARDGQGSMADVDDGVDAADDVEVASVQVLGSVTGVYVHVPSAAGVEIPSDELARCVAEGMARAVTAGILSTADSDS
jgi:hypothetical protein